MEQKNDMLGVEDIVFMLLETLKSNGTFDEIRRHCVTDIDAKPTYQNWKQRIESNVNKFLSKVKYTPELNKNTVRERLRKHLLDGRETQDIEEGADRILTQVLAPRTLSIFEPKIAVAVDEYLGIKKEVPPIELNGLKEPSMNLINVSNIENSTVFNPKIDFIPGADNIACDKTQTDDRKDLRSDKKEKSSSLCKEPKSLNGNRTDDENDTGGSLKPKNNQHKNKTSTSDKSKFSSGIHKNSKKDNSCKEVVDKSKDVINKPKDIINKSNDFIDKSKDVIEKSKDVIEKSKDVNEKSKDIVDKAKDVSKPKDIVDKSKDMINKPKDVNDKSKDIVDKSKDINDKSKDIVNKAKEMVEKSKDKLFLSKHSHSNSSSHKSNRTDTKRTKRSLEEKKKSSSLCKEPKLLNGNRSDDESNAGGSSKQKSTIHKNKSSSSDKTKSSSSNHKSSRKDNTSTDVVDKSKDKSLSKNSSRTDDKSNDKSLSKKSSSTDIDKFKDKSLSKKSNSSDTDKSKDKSLSKKSSSSDIDKPKDKSLSKKFSSSDTDKLKDKSSKMSSSTAIVDKSKDKSSSKISNSRTIDKSKDKYLSRNSSSSDIDKPKDKSLSKNPNSNDVDKLKNKSSLSKDSTCSSHKSNHNDSKRLKLSQPEKNKLPINNKSIEENKSEKPEWNDFRSSNITNDEQDAANVLLSMSTISYENSHSKIITENIIFIENSSSIAETSETSETSKIDNELEVEENAGQKKILPSTDDDIKENLQLILSSTDDDIKENFQLISSSTDDDIKENFQLISNNLETSQLLNSVKNVSTISHLFEKVCSVDLERLPCMDLKLQRSSTNNIEITAEHQKPAEIVVDEKELKILNVEINLNQSENEKTNECNTNDILKVPKLKLKLLPNQIDSLNKCKRKKHHKDKEYKKLKLSKPFDTPSEVNVSVIDSVPTNIMCEKSNNDMDVNINDSASTSFKQILHEEIENNSVKVLDDDKSHNSFKGFSKAETVPCKNYKLLKNVIKTLQAKMNNHDVINDGFKGFTIAETHPCKHRDIVYAELIKLKDSISSMDFIGFSEKETQMSSGHKYVIQQLELAKKQNNVDNHQQNVKCGENGKTFNGVVMAAYLYESNNDNDTASKEIYSKPTDDTKKDCPTVNNNNHNHDNWVVEQEMKYKLLPVKVKLERLMEFGCNNTKRVSNSPQLPI